LSALHPDHAVLVGRRLAGAGPVSYSLLGYRERPSSDTVTIEGVAVRESRESAIHEDRRRIATSLERSPSLFLWLFVAPRPIIGHHLARRAT